jgi:hypothetical protein
LGQVGQANLAGIILTLSFVGHFLNRVHCGHVLGKGLAESMKSTYKNRSSLGVVEVFSKQQIKIKAVTHKTPTTTFSKFSFICMPSFSVNGQKGGACDLG